MNSTTNTILIIILVILVGFGVWYFTGRQVAAPAQNDNGIDVHIGGDAPDNGTPPPEAAPPAAE